LKRAVIADSQFLVVETLKSLLEADQNYSLAGVAKSHNDLIRLLNSTGIDLLITDPVLFDYDSLEDLQNIKINNPELAILILTHSVSKAEFTVFSKIGIQNIIYKTAVREEVLSAIEAASRGKKYFSDEILDLILELSGSRSLPEEPSQLTASEIEIVKLIAGGMTTKEIAEKRCISFHTVTTHRKNIFRKLNVSSASELIMHAIKAGLIDNIEYFI
jgi:DNA-binding NarL/FixJ family response regulator